MHIVSCESWYIASAVSIRIVETKYRCIAMHRWIITPLLIAGRLLLKCAQRRRTEVNCLRDSIRRTPPNCRLPPTSVKIPVQINWIQLTAPRGSATLHKNSALCKSALRQPHILPPLQTTVMFTNMAFCDVTVITQLHLANSVSQLPSWDIQVIVKIHGGVLINQWCSLTTGCSVSSHCENFLAFAGPRMNLAWFSWF